MTRLHIMRRFTMLTLLCLLLASCAAATHQKPHQSVTTKPFFTNDASAPFNTPLCGVAAREQMAMGRAIYSVPYRAGQGCAYNACFSPLTSTFIASTGYRSVCR